MNALIYTKDDMEYISMAGILKDEFDGMDVYRDPLDGHGHYDYPYDVIVVALDGAKGMNTVEEWSERYPASRIIWLTSDSDFAKVAIRRHLGEFLIRPYDEERFRESVRRAVMGSATKRARSPMPGMEAGG